jgi:hypothetical protein
MREIVWSDFSSLIKRDFILAPIGLPSEEKRGLARDLLLLLENLHLTPKALELSSLAAGEPLPKPLIYLRLAHPSAKRTNRYPELSGAGPNASLTHSVETDGLPSELWRVGHADSLLDRGDPFLKGQRNRVKTKTRKLSLLSHDSTSMYCIRHQKGLGSSVSQTRP